MTAARLDRPAATKPVLADRDIHHSPRDGMVERWRTHLETLFLDDAPAVCGQ